MFTRRHLLKTTSVGVGGLMLDSLVRPLRADEPLPLRPRVVRFEQNPIIRLEMLPEHEGQQIGKDFRASDKTNINFPSLILVPDWLQRPLGKYYLYFSSHRGPHIRLAYADRLQGPWTIYKPGTLQLDDVKAVVGGNRPLRMQHVGSPDVHVDHERKEIRMYFHGTIPGWDEIGAHWVNEEAAGPYVSLSPRSQRSLGGGHLSGVALSKDGLRFQPRPMPLGRTYFRVFEYDGFYYAIDRDGAVLRSRDGLGDFRQVHAGGADTLGRFVGRIHHNAVQREGDLLSLYFSRTGDQPQCILLSRVELAAEPIKWQVSSPVTVLRPEMEYEGADLPVTQVGGGSRSTRDCAVRDPAIFREEGRTCLLYAAAGEWSIAIAELIEPN